MRVNPANEAPQQRICQIAEQLLTISICNNFKQSICRRADTLIEGLTHTCKHKKQNASPEKEGCCRSSDTKTLAELFSDAISKRNAAFNNAQNQVCLAHVPNHILRSLGRSAFKDYMGPTNKGTLRHDSRSHSVS